jgi:hypothetical protein
MAASARVVTMASDVSPNLLKLTPHVGSVGSACASS